MDSFDETQPDVTDSPVMEQNYINNAALSAVPVDSASLAHRPIGLTNLDLACYSNPLDALQRLRSFPETVDLVLSTEDGTIEPVHSFYLAVKAPKFWAQIVPPIESLLESSLDTETVYVKLYSMTTAENVQLSVPCILVPAISGPMLSIVVRSMYRGEVKLNVELSWQLLALARQFELDFLADVCLQFLASTLSADNCIHLMQVALQFSHPLAASAYRFLLLHFYEAMYYGREFGQLSLYQLKALLADDNLNITNEIFAWRAVITWIELSPMQRITHFWSLFRLVRCQLMHSKMIPQMVRDFALLNYCNGDVLTDKKTLSALQWPISMFNPRVPHEVVFLYGGYEHGLPSSTLKTFDIRSGKWFTIDLPGGSPRVHHAMVAVNGKLYIFGGSDGLKVLSSATVFDPATGRYRDLPPMSEPRVYHCAVKYREFIVVMGGNNGVERLRSCELYDISKKVWRKIANMGSARSDASAAVLDDKIFIAGGVEMFGLSSVEMYSFETRSWTVLSFMNMPRRGHALLAHKNSLFAIGGCTDVNEYSCLRSVEQMSPITNQWEFVASMSHARSSFAACVLEDKLFVFGGYDGFSSRKSIECYNYLKQGAKWETLSCLLETELSAASTVILAGLPNAHHFTYYGQCLLQSSRYPPTKADKKRDHQQMARLLVANSKKAHKQSNLCLGHN